jgi:hypothetical protein|tara:strand:+ start:228 stop:479 length:252 start_codon:yes stop_codon:yes gene_type:complete
MKKEPIDNSRIELAEKIHNELQASLELERKLLKKELTLQETMTERVAVRNDLVKCEKKIKDLTEQLQKENNGRKVTTWKQQQS